MTLPMTSIAALNAASRATFVAAIGFAFEDSPWIAEAAWDRRPFPDREALLAALLEVVHAAPEPQRIALIAAHPDLAGRVAREGRRFPPPTTPCSYACGSRESIRSTATSSAA